MFDLNKILGTTELKTTSEYFYICTPFKVDNQIVKSFKNFRKLSVDAFSNYCFKI